MDAHLLLEDPGAAVAAALRASAETNARTLLGAVPALRVHRLHVLRMGNLAAREALQEEPRRRAPPPPEPSVSGARAATGASIPGTGWRRRGSGS